MREGDFKRFEVGTPFHLNG